MKQRPVFWLSEPPKRERRSQSLNPHNIILKGYFSLMYSVYIIYSEKLDKHYIGYSSDVEDRLLKHNRKSKGFSSLGKPWSLVYTESFETKKAAMDREKQLKRWKNRERIESLIKTGSEHPDYLTICVLVSYFFW